MIARPLSRWFVLLMVVGLASSLRAQDPPKPEEPKKDEKPAEKPKEEAKEKDKEKEKKKPKDKYLAIINGEVHTITGPVLEGGTVLVKNGKIDQLGPEVKVPDEAKKIDAKGFKVYPGLIAVNSNNIVGREPVMDNTDPYSLQMVLGLAGGLTTVV